MPNRGLRLYATTVLLLASLTSAIAHGDSHHGDTMDMAAPPPPAQHNDKPPSYWSLSEHAMLMYWHIALEILAWVVVLPVGMSNPYLPLLSTDSVADQSKLLC